MNLLYSFVLGSSPYYINPPMLARTDVPTFWVYGLFLLSKIPPKPVKIAPKTE